MPRFKKRTQLSSVKHVQSRRNKRQRPTVYPVSPSPFKKRTKISTPGKRTPHYLKHSFEKLTPFLSPMVCSPVNISPRTNSNSKRRLAFESNTIGLPDKVRETCSLLKQLVQSGKFSTESISYKLFSDSLKWHSCTNTSSMRYSDEVKEFFWTGRRLLGGQFVRFMRGFAHTGTVSQGLCTRGLYDPEDSNINLPVPSDRILDDFHPSGISISTNLQPGIIHENIELYSRFEDESFVMMFDGKKIVPNTADVYLLNQEDEPKLAEKQAFFDTKLDLLNECIGLIEKLRKSENMKVEDIENDDRNMVTEKAKELLKELSQVSKSLRETYSKKKAYLQTLEKKFEETHQAKFKYAVDKIRTFLYKVRISLKDLMDVLDSVLQFCAILNGTSHMFTTRQCNLDEQLNYRELKLPAEVRESTPDNMPLHRSIVKQRTPEWFAIRETVKVTGSGLHKAIGLETLAAQKQHFDVVIGGKEPLSPSSAQSEAMSHGTDNEVNAVATIVSKVLPVYYPEYIFYEEGAFVIQDEDGRNITVVSPDGSLRDKENNRKVSVEAKCPFLFYVGSTPVYYDVKKRHIMQCLAEAEVMACTEHIYVSWSKESMTVFKMKPNKEIIQRALKEVMSIYYQEVPRRPTKLSENAKTIKQSLTTEVLNAEFLCEVPSVIGVNAPSLARDPKSPYYDPVQKPSNAADNEMMIEDIIESIMKAKRLVQDAYSYQKPMASEVLIHLLSDMNRTWKLEIGHGLPVSYLYKGYSLTMATCRRVLEEIVTACFAKGIHVACIAFDGQFAPIKDSDDQDNPLTLFVFHRLFWAKVKQMNKKELINAVSESFDEVTVQKQQTSICGSDGNTIVRPGSVVVTNAKLNVSPIKSRPYLIYKTVKTTDSNGNIEHLDTTGLEEDVANIIEDVVSSNVSSSEPDDNDALPNPITEDQSQVEQPAVLETDDTLSSSEVPVQNECSLVLEEDDFANMYTILGTSMHSKKWQAKSKDDLKMAFESATSMNKHLTGQDIHELLKYLNVKLTKNNVMIKQSLRKGEKINRLFELLGKASKIEITPKPRKIKKIKSLKTLCIDELNKRKYQKHAIAVAYAESKWPSEESKWYESPHVCVAKNVTITNDNGVEKNVFQPLYSPVFNTKRADMHVRVMDGTHIRTNIKSKIIRSGIENIQPTGWKEVAKSDETLLTPSLLEVSQEGKLIHQQSDPHVRTMFCEQVENQLRVRGFNKEAVFCRVFRKWHEAEDMPGLSAQERVQRSLNLRNWLLEDYKFESFPPRTQYVKGIPRVTFEGLVSSIDAHILLYAICKGNSYNWRSVSTLVAENFMGELAERSQNNHGVPSGHNLSADMTKISELHAMRLKPNRAFQMRTARSRAYTVPDIDVTDDLTSLDDLDDLSHGLQTANYGSDASLLDSRTVEKAAIDTVSTGRDIQQADGEAAFVARPKIRHVALRNHEFDKRVGGRAKMGTVRKFGENPRGVQSVRCNYKIDESKLLPSLSLGLSEDMIDNI